MPRARYRVQNWPAYDRALQERGSVTVLGNAGGTRGLAAAMHRSTRPTMGLLGDGYRDRAHAAPRVRPTVETNRGPAALHREQAAQLGLAVGVPDHTTFVRRNRGLILAAALASAQVSGGPVHVAIDATGLKVYCAGEWLVETHGERRRREWRKLHLAIDPGSGEVLACELTGNEEDNASQVTVMVWTPPDGI